jgi:hypothetical protein
MSDLSRRSLVTSAAALPVLAVPAIAIPSAEPDPIFAAIEKERALNAAFIARCHHENDLAEAGVELALAPGDPSRTSEMLAVVTASKGAREDLANTVPATLPGLVAYLDYVIAESEGLSSPDLEVFFFDGEDETLDFVRSLARSVRTICSLGNDERAVQS